MKIEALDQAIEEAKWFIARAEDLKRVAKNDKEVPAHLSNLNWHPRQSGAVKRASMDLSRALADLRNPNVNIIKP